VGESDLRGTTSLNNVEMLKKSIEQQYCEIQAGKKSDHPTFCLRIKARNTATGYVHTDVTNRYAEKLGPGSNAIAQ
jgi:hypothetical protein